MSADLTIRSAEGVAREYYLLEGSQTGTVHTKSAPNVPISASTSPAAAGGVYDVRDSESDKALAMLDWSEGQGQETLDGEKASAGRYLSSQNIDVRKVGQLQLCRPIEHRSGTVGGVAVTGPVFSAIGRFWMGFAGGVLKSTVDNGAHWVTHALTGAPTGTISAFCTDGCNVYCTIPTGGATFGIWRVTSANVVTRWSTVANITHIAFCGGYLYGCNSTQVGVFSDAGAFTAKNAAFLSGVTVSSVALVSAANAIYWVMQQGGRSYAFEVTNKPGEGYVVTQFCEYPAGFIATCALGYLSMLYVGGYQETSYAGVGRGGVYVCATNQSIFAPLFTLGDYPEWTEDPTSTENDNRVYALCEAEKDMYITTNRGIYRWDIDGSGLSHAFDLNNSQLGVTDVPWNTGSELYWDGSDLYAGVGTHFHPLGWTPTPDSEGAWTFTGGGAAWSAQLTGAAQSWVAVPPCGTAPVKDAVLNNANGSTLELVIPGSQSGDINVYLRDGVRECYVTIGASSIALHQWAEIQTRHDTWRVVMGQPGYWETTYTNSGVFMWSTDLLYSQRNNDRYTLANKLLSCTAAKTVRITLQGTTCTVAVNGDAATAMSTQATSPDASANRIKLDFSTGAAIDTITLNSQGGVGAGQETEVLSHPGIAFLRAEVMAPFTFVGGAGYAISRPGFNPTGSLVSSATTFHTGSLKKDYRRVVISHDELPLASTVDCDWWIDGQPGNGTAVTNAQQTETVIPINTQGYSIKLRIKLTPNASCTSSPVVRGWTCFFDFVKTRKHVYTLNCVEGAGSGRWGEDPTVAIQHVFDVADKQATFTDNFNGTYAGTIDVVEFTQANPSSAAPLEGTIRIQVKETQ